MGGDREDGNGEEGGGVETVEEEANEPGTSNREGEWDIVQELVDMIESAARFGDYRWTQKKECHNLMHRMKQLLPVFEELRDHETPVPETGVAWLSNLKKPLLSAKKLLRNCNEGSKIYMSLESEAVMIKFRGVYEKLAQVLDGFPQEELGVSDEVKEQVDLMQAQLKRAKRRTESLDIELAMDMMVVVSKNDERNADSAIIERLAKRLDLYTAEKLRVETIAVRNLVKERGGTDGESTQQIIDLLDRLRKIAGMEEAIFVDDPAMPRVLEKCPSVVIPHEFLCPIKLEIMTDPVIVASGQTFERESIQKWFASNHFTCPKTKQALSHLQLAPNCALKDLILQWCEKNKFQPPKKETNCPSREMPAEEEEEITALIENLSSIQLDKQRDAVTKIRMLSKENPRNRVFIAENGGIPPVVQLLSYPDSKIQEHAVTALLNLSIDEANKELIAREGAIPAIIEVLQNGNEEAKENSAAALFSLSMLDENKVTVGLSNGIPPLVDLLENGTITGKRDAVTALFNLSINHCNKARAIDAGIFAPLLKLLKDRDLGMIDEALSIFLLLASHPEGRQEIGQLSFVETVVELIQDGTPKNKECATSVLLELGSSNSSVTLSALQFGVYEHLVEITQSGTDRARRKADALLQLMSKNINS